MSLILDALNRSRQDVGDIPGLESQHRVADEPPGIGGRLWPLALVIALGVIAYLLYERGDENVPAPVPVQQRVEKGAERVEAQKTVSAPAQSQLARPAPGKAAMKASPTQVPATKKTPAPVAKVEPDVDVAALYAGEDKALEAPDPVADKRSVPSRPVVQESTQAAPVATEEPVDIERIVQQAQEELADARLDEHAAPFLASLSQQTKDGIPTIFYERHDYSGKPGQSSVVLNGRKVKPGGKTSGGVRVDEILADSVVLSFRGTQFRLRALNSWVNL